MDIDALARDMGTAFSDHERDDHRILRPEAVPQGCLVDVAKRTYALAIEPIFVELRDLVPRLAKEDSPDDWRRLDELIGAKEGTI